MDKETTRQLLKVKVNTTPKEDPSLSKELTKEIRKDVLKIDIQVNKKHIESSLQELKFSSDIEIDIIEIAEHHAFWSTLAEEADEVHNNLKIDYEKWYATEDTNIRNTITTKLTEAAISNKIKLLPNWEIKNKELNTWKKNVGILKNAIARSLAMKKDMIQTKSANMRMEWSGEPTQLEKAVGEVLKKRQSLK